MPTTEYKYKEKYFFISTPQMLNVEIPQPIKDKMGYYDLVEEQKVYHNITLGEAIQIKYELSDGNFAVSVQLSPDPLLPNKCVNDFITEEDFNEALSNFGNFGINEFLTLDEFRELVSKREEI